MAGTSAGGASTAGSGSVDKAMGAAAASFGTSVLSSDYVWTSLELSASSSLGSSSKLSFNLEVSCSRFEILE